MKSSRARNSSGNSQADPLALALGNFAFPRLRLRARVARDMLSAADVAAVVDAHEVLREITERVCGRARTAGAGREAARALTAVRAAADACARAAEAVTAEHVVAAVQTTPTTGWKEATATPRRRLAPLEHGVGLDMVLRAIQYVDVSPAQSAESTLKGKRRRKDEAGGGGGDGGGSAKKSRREAAPQMWLERKCAHLGCEMLVTSSSAAAHEADPAHRHHLACMLRHGKACAVCCLVFALDARAKKEGDDGDGGGGGGGGGKRGESDGGEAI